LKVDSKFFYYWKDYVKQSFYAGIILFLTSILLPNYPVLIACIGSSAFILFAMPNNRSSDSKQILAGHFLGFFAGVCFAAFPFMEFVFFSALWFSLSIIITIFLMIILDIEHPPAVGTTLGMVIYGYSNFLAIVFILSILILSSISHVTKPYLRDLV